MVVRLRRQGSLRGRERAALTSADYLGNDEGRTGLYALERCEFFNLLCLPPPAFDRDQEAEVWAAATVYCERRRAFLLIDPPAKWEGVQDAINRAERLGLTSGNAALYFPFLHDAKRNIAQSGRGSFCADGCAPRSVEIASRK
ncbi:MAG: hypothetical protein ACR2F0_05965 [Chthoniobacterales bacterium]